MPSLGRNIVANLIGGFWIGALTIVITPLQINLLGIEAYGFLGFIMALQVAVGMLDLGLSGTLTRQIASDASPDHRDSMPLLHTATTIYWALALLIGAAFAAAANHVSGKWVHADAISNFDITLGLQITGLFIASRWPVALYSGVLTGLQRLDVLNAVKAAALTVRMLGGILVLLLERDVKGFLIWLAISAIVEVLAFAGACRRVFPAWQCTLRLSANAVRQVWRFSLSIALLGALSIAITQLDRLLVGTRLSLEDLGHYALAHNAALAMTLILGAFSTAMMPSLAASFSSADRDALTRRYDISSRLVVFVTGALFFPMIFFGEALLSIWVGAQAAAGAWQPLAILAVGYWLSCIASNPSTLAVSCGRPQIPLQVTAGCSVLYMPALYFLTTNWGVNGAALAWVGLFGTCMLILTPIVHHQVFRQPVLPWYGGTVMPSLLLGIAIFGAAKAATLYASSPSLVLQLVIACVATALYGGTGLVFLGSDVREFMVSMARRIAGGPA
jgi:O-antigen/teichoic acid export membrane protein